MICFNEIFLYPFEFIDCKMNGIWWGNIIVEMKCELVISDINIDLLTAWEISLKMYVINMLSIILCVMCITIFSLSYYV